MPVVDVEIRIDDAPAFSCAESYTGGVGLVPSNWSGPALLDVVTAAPSVPSAVFDRVSFVLTP